MTLKTYKNFKTALEGDISRVVFWCAYFDQCTDIMELRTNEGVIDLTREDRNVLREVQRSSQMGLEAIQTIGDKVYDDGLLLDLNRQALKYTEYRNRARGMLQEAGEHAGQVSAVSAGMLKAGIHMNTAMNTSTSHVAELVIQGSNRGITDMCKAMNHNHAAGKYAMEIAKELMDFEEKSIERLKEYL